MIDRYTRPEMGQIWTEENKLRKWLEVELAALDALAYYRLIPAHIPALVRKKARFDIEKIKKIENTVQHDVIAFLTNISEHVGKDGRYVHYGLTSSDMLDTALAMQLKEASAILLKDLRLFLEALKTQARKYKWTVMAGRSHGVHAEPITFGLKMALFYSEFERNLERLERAAESVSVGKISGAVGTFAHIPPKIESFVCKKLGLKPAAISTQIIQRDRHAEYLTTLAIIGGSLEKLATEIRGLQKTETREVEEGFGKGQKGSSAMPHKRNPITCERVAGLARLLRGNATAAMENITLWHERDISHSSVERVIFPDSTIVLDYMLAQMNKVVSGLNVFPEQMLENLNKSRGMVFSQAVLLALVQKGLTREAAYKMVQDCARQVWEENKDFQQTVLNSREIQKFLKPKEIKELFDYRYYTKHVNQIFKRVGI